MTRGVVVFCSLGYASEMFDVFRTHVHNACIPLLFLVCKLTFINYLFIQKQNQVSKATFVFSPVPLEPWTLTSAAIKQHFYTYKVIFLRKRMHRVVTFLSAAFKRYSYSSLIKFLQSIPSVKFVIQCCAPKCIFLLIDSLLWHISTSSV